LEEGEQRLVSVEANLQGKGKRRRRTDTRKRRSGRGGSGQGWLRAVVLAVTVEGEGGLCAAERGKWLAAVVKENGVGQGSSLNGEGLAGFVSLVSAGEGKSEGEL